AAIGLLGRGISAEDRAGLQVVLVAERVAHDMRVRRDDDPLLALRVLDHDARIAGAGERCPRPYRSARRGHGAASRARPSLVKRTAPNGRCAGWTQRIACNQGSTIAMRPAKYTSPKIRPNCQNFPLPM